MAWTIPYQLLALHLRGDIDGVSIYTDRFGKKVFYPKAPPDKPPSARQVNQRQRFRDAVAQWNGLTKAEKAAWEEMSRRCNCPQTGHNLFIHEALKADKEAIRTLERQSGITVTHATYEPGPAIQDVQPFF